MLLHCNETGFVWVDALDLHLSLRRIEKPFFQFSMTSRGGGSAGRCFDCALGSGLFRRKKANLSFMFWALAGKTEKKRNLRDTISLTDKCINFIRFSPGHEKSLTFSRLTNHRTTRQPQTHVTTSCGDVMQPCPPTPTLTSSLTIDWHLVVSGMDQSEASPNWRHCFVS